MINDFINSISKIEESLYDLYEQCFKHKSKNDKEFKDFNKEYEKICIELNKMKMLLQIISKN